MLCNCEFVIYYCDGYIECYMLGSVCEICSVFECYFMLVLLVYLVLDCCFVVFLV